MCQNIEGKPHVEAPVRFVDRVRFDPETVSKTVTTWDGWGKSGESTWGCRVCTGVSEGSVQVSQPFPEKLEKQNTSFFDSVSSQKSPQIVVYHTVSMLSSVPEIRGLGHKKNHKTQ